MSRPSQERLTRQLQMEHFIDEERRCPYRRRSGVERNVCEGIRAAIATARQGRAGRQRNTRKRSSMDAAAYDPDNRSPQLYDTHFKMPILHRIRMIFFVEFGRPSRRVSKSC